MLSIHVSHFAVICEIYIEVRAAIWIWIPKKTSDFSDVSLIKKYCYNWEQFIWVYFIYFQCHNNGGKPWKFPLFSWKLFCLTIISRKVMIIKSSLVLRQIDELTSLLKNAYGNPCIQVYCSTQSNKKEEKKIFVETSYCILSWFEIPN